MSFVLGKLAWWLIRPGNLLLLLLLSGAAFRLCGRKRTGGFLIGGVILALAVIGILPFGYWAYAPLEARFPPPTLPANVDGIVVLGGAIDPVRSDDRGQLVLNGSIERLVAFAELARRYPEAKLVFAGGTGSIVNTESREGDWLKKLLPTFGLAESRVVIDRDSRNTHENAVNAKLLVKPTPGETWILITSASHMPRSVGVFRRQGWPVIAYPVDYQTMAKPPAFGLDFDLLHGLWLADAAAYEWVGLTAYYVRGWTDSFYPAP